MPVLANAIDALLPQTQCGQCGYAACLPYARALAAGECGPNRCPPGGDETLVALAGLLGQPIVPLDTRCGETATPRQAHIDSDTCIGCTKCIPACPVDAIVGASKRLHAVLTDECNGCGLCLAPCPVDCISLLPLAAETDPQRTARPAINRRRHQARQRRLAAHAVTEKPVPTPTRQSPEVQTALARARALLATRRA